MSAAPVKVSCPSANKAGPIPAMMTGDPAATGKGIIVVQEWWGLNQQIQDCGKEICGKVEMTTIVPDLYRGKVATDHETAGHYMGDLDWPGAVADIQACAQYLKSKGCKKVGVTGFCMGGALAMAAAAMVPEIDASAPFYGIPSKELCDVATIKVPLQCHFGEKDDLKGFTSPDDYLPLKKKLEDAKVNLEFFTYPCGHAFTNTTGPNFNKEHCEIAFSRMFDFFKKHLN